MTKKEIIWRYILNESLAKNRDIFTQKNIAATFHVSTSTVFNALKIPRKIGAVQVTGRFFRLRDSEKLLLLWATQRNLKTDIIYSTHVNSTPQKIEGSVAPDAVFAAFSAYKMLYGDPPADYSIVYIYSKNLNEIKKRFPPQKGYKNLYVLKPDMYISKKMTADSQTFVDLWNIPEWYAKDFLQALKNKMGL